MAILFSMAILSADAQGRNEHAVYKTINTRAGQSLDSNAIQSTLAQIRKHIQDPDSLVLLLSALLKNNTEISFSANAVQALHRLSVYLYENGDYTNALEAALLAIDLVLQQKQDYSFLPIGYHAAGNVQNRLGNTAGAARYYYQALASKAKYPESAIATASIYIGLSNLPWKDNKKIYFLNKAEQYDSVFPSGGCL